MRQQRSFRSQLTLVAISGALVLSLVACASDGSGGGTDKSAESDGKELLVVPYWLDNFGIAVQHWLTELAEAEGNSVTVINPDADTTAQVNTLSTAVASRKYDLIMWQPIQLDAQLPIAKEIQAAEISQVVFGVDVQSSGVNVPQVRFDGAAIHEKLANLGAQAVKKYFDQTPKAVFLTAIPMNPICEAQIEGAERGMKAVDPDAEIVYLQGVQDSSQRGALDTMSSFLNRGIEFNMTLSCGDTIALGMQQALVSSGRGRAVGKVPETEVQLFADGTPAGLQLLWSETSSVLFNGMLPPKDYAEQVLSVGNKLLSGSIPIDSTESMITDALILTADCEADRSVILEQYAGVRELEVPECSFAYDEKWEVTG